MCTDRNISASLLTLCLVFFSTIINAAQCKESEESNNQRAYDGYDGSGFKDKAWHRAVQTVQKGEKSFFRFKLPEANKKILYREILPITLGGGVKGFVAYLGEGKGCGRLLNSFGIEYPVPRFGALSGDLSGYLGYLSGNFFNEADDERPQKAVHLLLAQLQSGGFRYAIFEKGKLKKLSPKDYDGEINVEPYSSAPRNIIRDLKSKKHGVIDAQTLQETISPKWDSITPIIINAEALGDAPLKSRENLVYFWVTSSKVKDKIAEKDQKSLPASLDSKHFLYTANGTQLKLAAFDSLKIQAWWFPISSGASNLDRTVIEASNEEKQSCRIYTTKLNPVLNEDIPFNKEEKRCPVYRGYEYFAYQAHENKIKVFRTERGPRLIKSAEIDGRLKFIFDQGAMVVSRLSAQGLRYRAVGPDGKYLSDLEFTGFHNKGCDFIELSGDTKIYSLLPDGSLSDKRYFPFSC